MEICAKALFSKFRYCVTMENLKRLMKQIRPIWTTFYCNMTTHKCEDSCMSDFARHWSVNSSPLQPRPHTPTFSFVPIFYERVERNYSYVYLKWRFEDCNIDIDVWTIISIILEWHLETDFTLAVLYRHKWWLRWSMKSEFWCKLNALSIET